MSVVTLLREAAAAHDAVTITYNDGADPGTVRIILPVAVHGELLEAIDDPATSIRRLFRISTIAAVRCAGGKFALNVTAPRTKHSDATPICL